MSLQNKTILITGANGGLGLATAIAALREGATVVLACRTDDKANQARAQALAASSASDERAVAAGGFDMLDPSAIERAVRALPPATLDVVFLQAGGWVWSDSARTIESGGVRVEETIMKNVVGAHSTLAALMRGGRVARGGRVVMIGGEGARGVPGAITKPEFADLAEFRRYLAGDLGARAYVPINALGAAKLCAALWTAALARAASGAIEVLWFTPGLIGGTGGTQGMPAWKEFLFQRLVFPLLVWLGKAQWPEAAAAKCLDALAGRVGENGALLGAPEGTALGPLTDQTPMHPLFTDAAHQTALFRHCEAAAGPIPLEAPTSFTNAAAQ